MDGIDSFFDWACQDLPRNAERYAWQGQALLKKQLRSEEMPLSFANLSPCLVSMEACAIAPFGFRWTHRAASEHGHRIDMGLQPDEHAGVLQAAALLDL